MTVTHALILDAGSGLRRAAPYLDGVTRVDIALTHFHLDHVSGLAYLPTLPVVPTIWAPGAWLYERASEDLLGPFSPFEKTIRELGEAQRIGAFELTARAQPRHWHPTAGLRVGDRLALITDTAYDPGSAPFARGVDHLLHEAWSLGDEGDASAAEAAQVAADAGARRLTLDPHGTRTPTRPALLAAGAGRDDRPRRRRALAGRRPVAFAQQLVERVALLGASSAASTTSSAAASANSAAREALAAVCRSAATVCRRRSSGERRRSISPSVSSSLSRPTRFVRSSCSVPARSAWLLSPQVAQHGQRQQVPRAQPERPAAPTRPRPASAATAGRAARPSGAAAGR